MTQTIRQIIEKKSVVHSIGPHVISIGAVVRAVVEEQQFTIQQLQSQVTSGR
jgi:hypothetical protein